jgi:uncharacterized protein
MRLWIGLIIAFVVMENFGYAALQILLLRRRRPPVRWLEIAVLGWVTLMVGLFILQACEPEAWKPFMRDWLYLPMGVEMVWNVLFLQLLFPAMILATLIIRIRRPVARLQPMTPQDISRRRFVYLLSYGAVPAVAVGMGVHGTLTREDLRVRKFRIPIANLPPELEGFTIAHVSDLHSGLFVGPERLKRITDLTNDLKADLIAITGDIINRDMAEFPAALLAMQRMKSRYGMFLCEGNHDAIPGNFWVARACLQNNLPFLYNSTQALTIGSSRLVFGGLSWLKFYDMETDPGMVGALFPPRQPNDVRVLLAHHPDLFDIAQEADLVLSGHTHGGQIMLSKDVGLGRVRFKYCSGLYQRGATTMIVSNGCGDWFPCRIGAPAEIGLLRLTKAVG